MRWFIWYEDGTRYSSDETEWNDLPQHGVAYLMLVKEDGRIANYNGQDLYWHLDGIFANDNDRDGLLRRFPFVKFGTWVEPSKFKQITDEAKALGNHLRTN